MKEFLYHLIGQVLIITNILKYFRIKHIRQNGIHAIYSHNPTRSLFEGLVQWQKAQGYHFLSAEEVLEIIKGNIPTPPKAVWWSFDDGWLGNIENVLPVAEKYEVPITIFICTEAVEDRVYWWTKIRKYRHLLPTKYHDLNVIKTLSEDERQDIISQLDKQVTYQDSDKQAVNIEQLQMLAAHSLVSIGGHTHRHVMTPNCTKQQLEDEIKTSTEKLQKWLNQPLKIFAYPNGDFNGQEMELLKKYGYEAAFTTQRQIILPQTQNPFYLPRFGITDEGSVAKNLGFMFGIMQRIIKPLEHIIMRLKKLFIK